MFHVKPKDYIKATSIFDGKFIDGSFAELKDKLQFNVWNPEMFEVRMPDDDIIFGDDFLENYFELCKRYDIAIISEDMID